jgi:putative membrane protein
VTEHVPEPGTEHVPEPGTELVPEPGTEHGPAPGTEPPTYRRLSPLTPLVRAPIVLLAVIGGSWQQILTEGRLGFVALALLALLAAGAVFGVVSWARTKYWIRDDELRIDTGVVSRQSRRIRIDRLQGVDIVQPLVARFFGLAELKLDVAGGDREGSLAFLPHREALELRAVLLERRDTLRGAPAPSADGTADGAPVEGVVAPPFAGRADRAHGERPLGRLDPGLLVASLVLSSEMLWVVGAAIGIAVSVATLGSFAAVGGIVPALLALAVALGRKFTGYYGFRLSESAEGLHVRRGLTALSSQTIATSRIQGVAVLEPVLWRRFGWARLDVSVAGYRTGEGDSAEASSTVMPVAPREEVVALAAHVIGGRDGAHVPLSTPPSRSRWLAPFTAWTLAAGADPQLVVSRRGFWVRRLDVVPHARVQSARVTQGALQRLLHLADVHVDSPPGPVHVRARHLDAADARPFTDALVVAGRAARRERAAAQVEPAAHPGPGDSPSDGTTPPAPETTQ